jgi:hypothetical protein
LHQARATCGAGNHSTPGRCVLPRIYFLFVRIFLDLRLGSIVNVVPSGMFPGGSGGARTWRSQSCGRRDHGLDRFSI